MPEWWGVGGREWEGGRGVCTWLGVGLHEEGAVRGWFGGGLHEELEVDAWLAVEASTQQSGGRARKV